MLSTLLFFSNEFSRCHLHRRIVMSRRTRQKRGAFYRSETEVKTRSQRKVGVPCVCFGIQQFIFPILSQNNLSIFHAILSMLSFAVIGFVASTLPELEMLVQMACSHEGPPFHDLLYAMPICYTEFPIIYRIKEHLMRWVGSEGVIHVLVDSDDQLDRLEHFVADFGSTMMNATKWSVFLKLDTGYHRAGVTCDSEGVALATRIINSSHCSLRGLYSHW